MKTRSSDHSIQNGYASRRWQCLACVGLAVTLTACDVLNGVRRSAKLDALPDLACVEAAIRDTPPIETVTRTTAQSGKAITITGVKPAGDVYNFIFKGSEESNVFGVVQFATNWRGYVEFSNYDYRINTKPPQSEIDATRPVMQNIEKALHNRCGIDTLAPGVTEYCHGIECKSLEQSSQVTVRPGGN